mmetsp:Transcript_118216/g.215005  ORF Transcript_118216/g.215005 Transcript_118216/m.215005 type:complete len:210 (+) Transcript_118216:389-1018(+)
MKLCSHDLDLRRLILMTSRIVLGLITNYWLLLRLPNKLEKMHHTVRRWSVLLSATFIQRGQSGGVNVHARIFCVISKTLKESMMHQTAARPRMRKVSWEMGQWKHQAGKAHTSMVLLESTCKLMDRCPPTKHQNIGLQASKRFGPRCIKNCLFGSVGCQLFFLNAQMLHCWSGFQTCSSIKLCQYRGTGTTVKLRLTSAFVRKIFDLFQ